MYEFNEKQKFNQWWIWIFIILITVGCTYGAVQQLIFNVPFGNNPATDEALIVLCMVPLIVIMVFSFMFLETKINSNGVSFRFRPIHFKFREISWEEIDKIYTREYRPIKEYGGWGIKGSFKKGKAYNVSGNKGIQIELKNGKKILIGTQKTEEVESILLQLNKK